MTQTTVTLNPPVGNRNSPITLPIDKGSKRVFQLMKEDYILVKVTLAEPLNIGLGWYTDEFEGRRFEIVDLSAGSINAQTGAYEYDLRLDAQYYKFKHKLMKLNPTIGAHETAWTFTADLLGHLEQILWNLNAYAPSESATSDDEVEEDTKDTNLNSGFLYNGRRRWSSSLYEPGTPPAIIPTKNIAKSLSYSSTNVIDAINQLAQEYDVEWWFEGHTLRMGKCERGQVVTINHENALISHSTSSERKATRIYAYGSTRNIPGNYRKKLLFDLNQCSVKEMGDKVVIDFCDYNRKLDPEQHLFGKDKVTEPVAKSNLKDYSCANKTLTVNQGVSGEGDGIYLESETGTKVGELEANVFVGYVIFEGTQKPIYETRKIAITERYGLWADAIHKRPYFPAGTLLIEGCSIPNQGYIKVVDSDLANNWHRYYSDDGKKKTYLELNLWIRCYKAEYDEATKIYKASNEYHEAYTTLSSQELTGDKFNTALTLRANNVTSVQLPYNCAYVHIYPYISAKVVSEGSVRNQEVQIEVNNYKVELFARSGEVTTASRTASKSEGSALKFYPTLPAEELPKDSLCDQYSKYYDDYEKAKAAYEELPNPENIPAEAEAASKTYDEAQNYYNDHYDDPEAKIKFEAAQKRYNDACANLQALRAYETALKNWNKVQATYEEVRAKYEEIRQNGLDVTLNPDHQLRDQDHNLRITAVGTVGSNLQALAGIFKQGVKSGMPFRIEGLFEATVPWAYFTPKYSLGDKNSLALNSIVNKQLLLPEAVPNSNPPIPLNGYIDIGENITDDDAIEDVVTFEDIYPTTESRMTEVYLSSDKYEDTEANGNSDKPIVTEWYPYRFKCDTFQSNVLGSRPFSPMYLTGEDLSIVFLLPDNKPTEEGGEAMQAGKNLLAGMTFRVRHISGTDEFEIIRDDETKLPNAVLHPTEGDRFAFVNINIAMLDAELVQKAENKLYEEAIKYIEKKNKDNSTYTAKLYCDVAKQWQEAAEGGSFNYGSFANYLLGRKVKLESALYFPDYVKSTRMSRILGFELPLDYPYDNPTLTIGEKGEYSRLGEIEDKIDSIGAAAGRVASTAGNTMGGSGVGGNRVQILATGNTAKPTDENVFSALRSQLEFMLASAVQKVKYIWHFLRGLTVGEYVKGLSGAAITEEGDAEMRSAVMRKSLQVGQQFVAGDNGCKIWEDEFGNAHLQVDFAEVTKKATFAELEIKKLTHSGGVIILSPASMEADEVVVLSNGDYKIYSKASDPQNPSKTIDNQFQEYDLARCQTFNVRAGTTANAGNRYYWRAVVEAGQETNGEVTRNYIVLSKDDCDPAMSNDAPCSGDSIVMFGNKRNRMRQNLVIISSYGADAPSIRQYQGINTYSLPADKLQTCISPNGNKFCGEFSVEVNGETQPLQEFLSERGISYTMTGKCEEREGDNVFYVTPYRIKDGAMQELYLALGDKTFAIVNGLPLRVGDNFALLSGNSVVTADNTLLQVGNKLILLSGTEPLVFSMTCECLNKEGTVIYTDVCSNGTLVIAPKPELSTPDLSTPKPLMRSASITQPAITVEPTKPGESGQLQCALVYADEVENVRFTLYREQGGTKTKLAECVIDGSAKRQTLRSDFTVKADEIKQSVSSLDGKYTELKTTVDGIRFTVSDPVTGLQSKIDQTSSALGVFIENTNKGLSSTGINITTGEITLQAEKVKIQGKDENNDETEAVLIFEKDGTINARRVIAYDANGKKVASMNEENDGAYRIYYPAEGDEVAGPLRLIFQPADLAADIIQYKGRDGQVLWSLGDNGYKENTVLQTWYSIELDDLGTSLDSDTPFNGHKKVAAYKVINGKQSIYTTDTPESKVGSKLTFVANGWYGFPIVTNNGQRSRTIGYIEGGELVINGYSNEDNWEAEKKRLQTKYNDLKS